MIKQKFETYNDGLLYYGAYIESYDTDGYIKGREFTMTGKLFFNMLSIREEDRYSFDSEESKISLKIKVRKNNFIKTYHIIKINNDLYNIKNTDPDKNNIYLYLSNHVEELDRILEIYEIKETSTLEDSSEVLYEKVFANIKNINSVTNSEREVAGSIKSSERLKFKIKYLKELTDINSTNRFKVKFEKKFYNIKQIIDIDMLHEILEVEGELDGVES